MSIEIYQYPIKFLQDTSNIIESPSTYRNMDEYQIMIKKAQLLRICMGLRHNENGPIESVLRTAYVNIGNYNNALKSINKNEFSDELKILFMIWQDKHKKKICNYFVEQYLIKDLTNIVMGYYE